MSFMCYMLALMFVLTVGQERHKHKDGAPHRSMEKISGMWTMEKTE